MAHEILFNSIQPYSYLPCIETNFRLIFSYKFSYLNENASEGGFFKFVTTRTLFVYPCYTAFLSFEISDDLFYPLALWNWCLLSAEHNSAKILMTGSFDNDDAVTLTCRQMFSNWDSPTKPCPNPWSSTPLKRKSLSERALTECSTH